MQPNEVMSDSPLILSSGNNRQLGGFLGSVNPRVTALGLSISCPECSGPCRDRAIADGLVEAALASSTPAEANAAPSRRSASV